MSRSPKWFFLLGFPTKIVYAFIISPVHELLNLVAGYFWFLTVYYQNIKSE
jgi:hypothetical protein